MASAIIRMKRSAVDFIRSSWGIDMSWLIPAEERTFFMSDEVYSIAVSDRKEHG